VLVQEEISGLENFRMAALRALLSRITAAEDERSASSCWGRLFEDGFGGHAWFRLRFIFASITQTPFARKIAFARDAFAG